MSQMVLLGAAEASTICEALQELLVLQGAREREQDRG
jgi:hypothetical protein